MSPENRQKFLFYAREHNRREACALLIIERGIESLVLCKNISELDQQFIIDPVDYQEAEDRGEIIAVVHSHPASSPLPSEADRVTCERTKLVWYICGALSGDWFTLKPSGYSAPLIGREWAHGVLDCYSLIRDYYAQELRIFLPEFKRNFEWWLKGGDLYEDNYSKAGFVHVADPIPKKHDILLMQLNSPVINHGAIYLGNERFLHHLHKRLSSRDIYGGFWHKHTLKILRHRSQINANG